MDLLGGYGSDSSSDASTTKPPTDESKRKQGENVITKALAAPVQTTNKKKRKLLRLGAVLPSEIFDKLVDMQYGRADDDDDDDDGEDGLTSNNLLNNKRSVGADRSGACQDLLSKLKASAPKKHEDTDAALDSRNSVDVKEKLNRSSNEIKQPEVLGEAFMKTTVLSMKRKKGGIVDVHADAGKKNDSVPQKKITALNPARTSSIYSMARRNVISAPSLPNNGSANNEGTRLGSGGIYAYPIPDPHDEEEVATVKHAIPSKMSKKEIQRALREGNLGVLKGQTVAQYEQRVSSFDPSAEDMETDYDAAHRIKHVAVGLYDPSLGKYFDFACFVVHITPRSL